MFFRFRNPDLIPAATPSSSSSRFAEPEPRGFGPLRTLPGSSAGATALGVNRAQPCSVLGTLGSVRLSTIKDSGDGLISVSEPAYSTPQPPEVGAVLRTSRSVLVSKLQWANRRLEEESGIENCSALVKLIKDIVVALNTIDTTHQV